MRNVFLCFMSAFLAQAATAQDMVGFDLSTFGNIVLNNPELGSDEDFEAAFGINNNEPISKYPGSVFADLGRAVGRLDIATDAGLFPCTAFLVDDDLLMTNHHCVPGILNDRRFNATSIVGVKFTAGYTIEGVAEGAVQYLVNPVPVETSKDLDYTLLRVVGAKPGQEFRTLKLASAAPLEHAPFWIIGHPGGQAQHISRESCAAANPAVSGNRIRHNCDTAPGNSGSPVIDAGTQMVVGLHNAGSKAKQINYAVPMSLIRQHSKVLKPDAPVLPDLEVQAMTRLGEALALDDAVKEAALSELARDMPQTSAGRTAGQLLAALTAPSVPAAQPAPASKPVPVVIQPQPEPNPVIQSAPKPGPEAKPDMAVSAVCAPRGISLTG